MKHATFVKTKKKWKLEKNNNKEQDSFFLVQRKISDKCD